MSAKSVETDGVAVPNRAAPAAILSPAESAKRISDQLESHVHSGERSVELVCFLLGKLLDCCYGISSVAASLAAMIDADLARLAKATAAKSEESAESVSD